MENKNGIKKVDKQMFYTFCIIIVVLFVLALFS